MAWFACASRHILTDALLWPRIVVRFLRVLLRDRVHPVFEDSGSLAFLAERCRSGVVRGGLCCAGLGRDGRGTGRRGIIAGSFVGCLSGVGWRAFVISAWPGAVCLRSGAGGAEDGARLRFFLGVQKRDPWHQVRTYPRREKQILRPAFPIVCCRTQRGPKSPQRRRPVLGDPDGRAGFQDDTASGNGAMRTRGAWLRGAMPSPIDGVRGQSEVRAFPP